ncbi:MAG TPA: riboflavin synthase [Solirubrobacteraceae bacterium]|jgi:riboflavin synthase|nr:riboflavin synthase [Solirubrobacteraceae bacterium]
MFTGLIADLGSVKGIESDADGATLEIATALADELAEGDSIAVNGVCLTATVVEGGAFRAQAMQETLRRSSLERLQPGSRVNLELALRADGRLGGHIVQGHVDGTGAIAGQREEGFARVLQIELAPRLARYLVEKGSVAVDGVSLTVSEVHEESFSVSLIPETLTRTNLGEAQIGDRVNIEADILAKHVERLIETEAHI